jgi:membrane fusion protein (multidrug efflux system)
VSVGDYVSRGTKTVSVVRLNPMRVELTVPGQYLASLAPGRTVSLQVDAYPGKTFTGKSATFRRRSRPTRARSSSKRSFQRDRRAETGSLCHSADRAGILDAGHPRAFHRDPHDHGYLQGLRGLQRGTVEERIVTTGQTAGDLVEITSGLARGETVATSNVAQLGDGVRIAARK